MKVLLILIAAMMTALSNPTLAGAALIDGKVWRELTETTGVSWDQLDAIYDTSDGELLDPSISTIGTVDFAGWIWADNTEIAAMFSSYSGLSIGPTATVTAVNSSWAPAFFNDLVPTSPTSLNNTTFGWSRTEKDVTDAFRPTMRDNFNVMLNDSVQTGIGRPKGVPSSTLGVWLYESDAAPIPEPATIALLGIGLAGLAGVAVRRRFKRVTR